MAHFIPKQGDFIALTFDPQSGHEQKGRRPAFVVSKELFNRKTGLAIVFPVTNTNRGFPLHVPTSGSKNVTGFIMLEQIKSVDTRSRGARLIENATDEVLSEVLAILEPCIYDTGNDY